MFVCISYCHDCNEHFQNQVLALRVETGRTFKAVNQGKNAAASFVTQGGSLRRFGSGSLIRDRFLPVVQCCSRLQDTAIFRPRAHGGTRNPKANHCNERTSSCWSGPISLEGSRGLRIAALLGTTGTVIAFKKKNQNAHTIANVRVC